MNDTRTNRNRSPVVYAVSGWLSYDAIEPYLAAPTEENIIDSMSTITL